MFKAIADPTRREIIRLLAFTRAALTINDIVENFQASRQAVTKHIKQLEEAGLVRIEVDGRERYCRAEPARLLVVRDWISAYEEFWDRKLGDLGDYLDLAGSQKQNTKKKKSKRGYGENT